MNHIQKLIQPDFVDCRYKIYLFTTNEENESVNNSIGATFVNDDIFNNFFDKIKNSNIFNFAEENYEKIYYLNYEIINNNFYQINHIYHTKIKDMIVQIDNYKQIRDNNSISEINNILKSNINEDFNSPEKEQISNKIFHDKINNFKVVFENNKEIYITFTLNEKNVKVILDLLNKIGKLLK